MKPNILFVFADQHRKCSMGLYGDTQVRTPNFDAFAKDAVVFENCISNYPVCVPARGNLLTGLHACRHKAASNDLAVDTSCESVADVMTRNGYDTGYIGKWHLGGVPRDQAIGKGRRLGFDFWKVCNCNHDYMQAYYYDEENRRVEVDGYEPITQTNIAIDYIQTHASGKKPWGLYVSYGTPHSPYDCMPKEYLEAYRTEDMQLRPNVLDVVKEGRAKSCNYLNKEDMKRYQRGYYAHITALDEQFGRLLEALKKSGQADHTIIVYTADHGDMLGGQGYVDKQLPYNESINVPLLVYWKGKTHHFISNELMSLTDLPVSLMGLAGMKFETDTDGKDYSALFTDEQAQGPEYVNIMDLIPCHNAIGRGDKEWQGIKTKTHTYARSTDGKFKVLYDDIQDPYQLHNLADDEKLCAKEEEKLQECLKNGCPLMKAEDVLVRYGLKDEWNKSQSFFGLKTMD